jgi:hypothetical protein
MAHPGMKNQGLDDLRLAIRSGNMEQALSLLEEEPGLPRLAAFLARLGDVWPEGLEQGGSSGVLEELAWQLDPRRLH